MSLYQADIKLTLDDKDRALLVKTLGNSAMLLDRKAVSLQGLGKPTAGGVVDEASALRAVAAQLRALDTDFVLTYPEARIVRRSLSVTVDKIETAIERQLATENTYDHRAVTRLEVLEDILEMIVEQMLDARTEKVIPEP